MHTLLQVKDHLIGMGHGGTLNKVREQEAMFERSGAKFLLKHKPLTAIRTLPLTQTVLDDLYTYAAPSDFGSLIDLIPEDNRNAWDNAYRNYAGKFDLEKAIKNKTLSIEGSEGTKIFKINWKSRQSKVLNSMDSLTSNGTWAAQGTATNVALDEIIKILGAGSISFDAAVTGDGIKNTSMTAVDLTDESGIADVIVDFYIKNAADLANLTSMTVVWGNDITTKYWTGTAQTTQADGTAFRVGWNTIRIPWNTATQSGTVAPATIDSLKITVTVLAAITKIRVDNVRFAIGRNFDAKYYSKFLFKISATGVWASRPTSDDDYVIIDNDALPSYLFECLKDMAHQMEGTDSAFDINYARQELQELFPHFAAENPNQSKKPVTNYGGLPRFRR